MQIQDLKSYTQNVKMHTQSQIDELSKSIEKFGFNVPVLIDKDNNIVAGHARVEAAKKLNIVEVKEASRAKKGENFIPVIRLEDLTPNEIKLFRVVDNKLNESGWNFEALKAEIGEIQESGLEIIGFDSIELGRLVEKSAKELQMLDGIGENEFGEYTSDLVANNKEVGKLPNSELEGATEEKRVVVEAIYLLDDLIGDIAMSEEDREKLHSLTDEIFTIFIA